MRSYPDGRIKQYVINRALELRRAKPALFTRGEYSPLQGGEHVVAFERSLGDQRLLCVVPRLTRSLTKTKGVFALGELWGPRRLEGVRPGRYQNVLTGHSTDLDASPALSLLLRELPLGLWIGGQA